MQKKKTAHNKANETKNANVTARATEKVIVDKKTPEEKKEETEREEVPKSGKAKLISILSAVVLALILIFKPELLQGVIDSVTAANADGVYAAFIDVGQGDCEFIELPNGQTVLIDTGESGNEEKISSFIHNKGYNAIDYFIMTHPHADHIGSSAAIIKEFDIKNIYMPKKSHTSKTFENMLDAVSEKGYSLKTAKAGVSLLKDDNLSMEFLAPVSENYDDLNN